MAYFANLCVNLRDRLCDVASYVSAQSLDFLDIDEISSFLNWKHQYVPILKEVKSWMDTSYAIVHKSNLSKNHILFRGEALFLLEGPLTEDPHKQFPHALIYQG